MKTEAGRVTGWVGVEAGRVTGWVEVEAGRVTGWVEVEAGRVVFANGWARLMAAEVEWLP